MRSEHLKTLKITETVLRDGQQSQIATRMPIEDMIPILDTMDQAGYYATEVWGGATFDACLRYLNEDPWERLRTIRSHFKHTKLSMLLRGQNILGYHHFPDDIVERFVAKSIENGIDIIRIFDALNDVRNLTTAVNATKKAGGHAQIAIAYTTSPVHTIEYYVDLVKRMEILGADSIAVKDMAGVLTPQTVYSLVSEIKKISDLPINVHTHATSGNAEMVYLKAVEAGADIIDTAISSFSGGTSQPATESLNYSLNELGYETGVDQELLVDIANHFNQVRDKFRAEGLLNPKVKDTEPKTLLYQVPGGMLSNLLSQLEEQGNADLYEEVLAEVPKVRKELGYPPLVTPLSQMVGTQALMNIVSGERYKLVPKEIRDYVKGLYGQPPASIDEDVQALILKDDTDIYTGRPADLLSPGYEEAESKISEFAHSEEDILSYALYPEQAYNFLGRRGDPFFDVPIQTVNVHIDV